MPTNRELRESRRELRALAQDAARTTVPVADLLRRLKLLRRTFGVSDDGVDRWIDAELRGYDRRGDVPEYRQVYGEFFCDFVTPSSICSNHPIASSQLPDYMAETSRVFHFMSPIAELENLLGGREGQYVATVMPAEVAEIVCKFVAVAPIGQITRVGQRTPLSSCRTVLEHVRLRVGDLVAELLGSHAQVDDGTAPARSARRGRAQSLVVRGTNNVVVQGSGSQQTVTASIVDGRSLVHDLRAMIRIPDADAAELQHILEAEPRPATGGMGPRLARWFTGACEKVATGVWERAQDVAVGAALTYLRSKIPGAG